MPRFVLSESDRDPADSSRPLLQAEERVVHHEADCRLYRAADGSDADAGIAGDLFITEERVVWLDSDSPSGFAIDYPFISLHAVSTDPASFPRPCLLLHLDAEEDYILRVSPSSADSLQLMYSSMTECVSLHPDADEDDVMGPPGEAVIHYPGAAEAGESPNGDGADDDARFEDAEE